MFSSDGDGADHPGLPVSFKFAFHRNVLARLDWYDEPFDLTLGRNLDFSHIAFDFSDQVARRIRGL